MEKYVLVTGGPNTDFTNLNQVYFGFTHCPDICPEELDKMSAMIDLVSLPNISDSSPSSSSSIPGRSALLPIFITCDPARDSPSVLKSYLAEFHTSIVGVTGTWEQVKQVCKAYRVYFSTPEGVKPGQDYLVDHSIYFYLMGWLYSFASPPLRLCELYRMLMKFVGMGRSRR